MNRLHLVEFQGTRPSARQAVAHTDKPPVCIECANGYHEQLLTDVCSCPCHGNPTNVVCEVAA